MVPSDREQIDMIVAEAYQAWSNCTMRDGEGGGIAECVGECPSHVLSLFADEEEWSRNEEHCRQA